MLGEHPAQSKRTGDPATWQALIDAAQQAWLGGDPDRAQELFGRFQDATTPWLLAAARAKGAADDGEAEELVAQAHYELWLLVEAGDTIRNAKGLAGTIVRRRAIDALRRRQGPTLESADEHFWRQHETIQLVGDDPFDRAEARESAKQLTNVLLDQLPRPERAVIEARYLRDRSVSEAAADLGITEDQVKKRCRQALRLAREIATGQDERDAVNGVVGGSLLAAL